MNRKIAFLVIFIFIIFLCSSCFAYSTNDNLTTIDTDHSLVFSSPNDFLTFVINYGDTNYYTINEILNSNYMIWKGDNDSYNLWFDISKVEPSTGTRYAFYNSNNVTLCGQLVYSYTNGFCYKSKSSSMSMNSNYTYYFSNDLYYLDSKIFEKNFTYIPPTQEEPIQEEPTIDYTTLIEYNNQLLEINNSMLIIIIFLILIYWLGKMFYMFFKATIL